MTVLAQDYQVLARSPDPRKVFAGSPAPGRFRAILRVRMQGEAAAGICGVCGVEDYGERLTNRFAQFQPMDIQSLVPEGFFPARGDTL